MFPFSIHPNPFCFRVRFGRITFYVNLVIYIGYLFSLTFYTAQVGTLLAHLKIDTDKYCPIFSNESMSANYSIKSEEVGMLYYTCEIKVPCLYNCLVNIQYF